MAATSLIAPASVRSAKPLASFDRQVTSSACRPADSVSAREIARWQTKMHSTSADDSLDIAHAQLPYVPDTAFAVVADSATCATALTAHNSDAEYNSTELASTAAASVYVVRVGSRYITWNPDFRTGEWITHTVWNSSFVALSHYLL
jgi:hypothetical protein